MPAPDDELTPAARRILAAAAELFYGRGITAVGVDLIARHAGVTKKTLYDRFGSKDELIARYLRERDREYRDWLTGHLDGPAADGSPRARVLATFDALGRWMRERNPRGCGFVNAAAELPDPGHPAREVIAGQKRWLRDVLRAECASAGLAGTAADDLAEELLVLHEGATVLNGLNATTNPIAAARRLAEIALDRAGVTT
ncbi:TetR/AcrR family transcriptional regulator [Streptomyces litchfieldiae]|uniref:TetR/AcrR family transcriptional regulator n=1 Tax=Streptomyces litchfieldiae TaxID=3075543 RepID=A0ABU2MT13_9ACTN|nr:TetR/AcrR family transcriptional regulator [Streptomyces sp. DSM 44938]MDT0344777.1 TetR/AcrR family transcriptional regulator [Streptomyces sp. DSM 44938]